MNDYSRVLQEIKDKVNIVDVISEHVSLEKQGTGFVGLCPFHDDKNPSMNVSPSKKIFKCFSCNAGGDSVAFVQRIKGISFSEALREVGSKVGVHVALSKKDLFRQQHQKQFSILNEASNLYRFYLKNTIEGQAGLEYLKNRKISEDCIQRFQIGLSSSDSDLLYRALIEKEHFVMDMIEVGLVREHDGYYDVFRKRIMFPITDLDGQIVGFSGRKYLPNSPEAKYVNTSETPFFKKGEILYNYYEASSEIRKESKVYLFEGFMDVIAAYRAGIHNTIASMGTALTSIQIQAIKRLTDHVVLCYDGDEAGIAATKRAIQLLLQQNCTIDVVFMENGLDPDDYINKHGEAALASYLKNRQTSAIEYLFQMEKKDLVVSDINSVEKFKQQMFAHLSYFQSNVVVERTIGKMSEELNISSAGLLSDFHGTKGHYHYEKEQFQPRPTVKTKNRFETTMKKFDSIQRELISIAIAHPETCVEIESRFNNHYLNTDYRDIMLHVHQYYYSHEELNNEIIKSKLDQDIVGVFEELLTMKVPDHVTRMELLLEEFDKFPSEKIKYNLAQQETKTPEDTDRLAQEQKVSIRVLFDKE